VRKKEREAGVSRRRCKRKGRCVAEKRSADRERRGDIRRWYGLNFSFAPESCET